MNNEINVNTNENKISNINYSNVEQTNKKHFSLQEIKQIWKDSLGFKPIISYLYFLFVFLIKKKGTWIIPLISFLLILIFSLIPSFMGEVGINNLMLYFSIVISLFFSISFVVVKVINIFKDGQDEGIEIIIVSKPIERWQIIIAKFTMFVAASLFITFINVIALSIGFGFSWNYSLYPQGFGNTIGAVIGGTLLVCLFFGSLTVLFSLKFGKKLSANLPTTIFSVLFGVSMITSLIPSLGVTPSNTVDGMIQNISLRNGYNYSSSNISQLIDIQKIDYNNKNHLIIRLKNDTTSTRDWNSIYLELKEIFDSSYGSGDWIKALKWLNVVNIPLDNDTGFKSLSSYFSTYQSENTYVNPNTYYFGVFDMNYSYELQNTVLPKNSQGKTILQNFYEIPDNYYNTMPGMQIMIQNNTNWSNIKIPEYTFIDDEIGQIYGKYNYENTYFTGQIIDQLSNNKNFINDVLNLMRDSSSNSIYDYKTILDRLVTAFQQVGYIYSNGDELISFDQYNTFLNKYLDKKIDVSKLFKIQSENNENNEYIDYIPTILLIASFNIMYDTYYTESVSKQVVDQIANLTAPIESIPSMSMNVNYFKPSSLDNIDNSSPTGTKDIRIGTYNNELSGSGTSAEFVPDSLPFTIIENINQLSTNTNSPNVSKTQEGALIVEAYINQSPSWGIGLLWFFISIGLLSFSVWTYYRRDFR